MLAGVPDAGGGDGKKLEQAVELWASGQFSDEEDHVEIQEDLQADLAFFGLVPEEPLAPPAVDEFYLWPENVPAWDLWMGVQTQWRVGVGGREGLDYAGVEVEMRMQRVRPNRRRRRWAELKVMERTALRVWREQASRRGS